MQRISRRPASIKLRRSTLTASAIESHRQNRSIQMLMRTRTDATKSRATDLAVRLSRSYQTLFRGFTWIGSEGDDAYHAFSASFDPMTELTAETFRAAARIDDAWKIEIAPAEPWFARMIQFFHDNQFGSENDHAIEIVYAHLQEAMKATLEGPLSLASVHYAPSDGSTTFHKARYYVFGRVAEGGLAGLMAKSVET